jgi:hypothetical protein
MEFSESVSFALSGLGHVTLSPTAYAVGYILEPLRGSESECDAM